MKRALLALVLASTALQAQTPVRVLVTDSVLYRFVAKPRVDTVRIIVHDTVRVCPDSIPKPPVDTTTPPPVDPGSPVPQPGDVIIWQDNFNARTDLSVYAKSGLTSIITPGVGGIGKAARFTYTQADHDALIEKSFAATADIYFSYKYRIKAGWLPYSGSTGSGMKWFMPWRGDGQPRYTCGVGLLAGGPLPANRNTGWEFTCHDNSSARQPNPFNQNIDKTRKFSTTNDGNWHTYVLRVKVGTGGFEQIWVDGVLVLNDAGYGYDHSASGINMFQFPGLIVDCDRGQSPLCSGTIDIDDFVVWRKP